MNKVEHYADMLNSLENGVTDFIVFGPPDIVEALVKKTKSWLVWTEHPGFRSIRIKNMGMRPIFEMARACGAEYAQVTQCFNLILHTRRWYSN